MELIYTLHIDPAEEGGFIVYFPAFPGCQTQGESVEEVLLMAKDALAGFVEALQEEGKPMPRENHPPKQVGFDFPFRLSLAR